MNALLSHRAAKPLLFLLALGPIACGCCYGALTNALGAEPGRGADPRHRRLDAALPVPDAGRHAAAPDGPAGRRLARLRRMLGLFAFFYGLLHLLCYAWLDMGFDVGDIVRDIPKRPFVLVGTLALLLMLPLAATSFNRAIRALGAARWRQLHRLVYAIVLLGLLHFFWMRSAKNDFGEVRRLRGDRSRCCSAGGCGRRRAGRRDAGRAPASLHEAGQPQRQRLELQAQTSATTSATTNSHTPRKICGSDTSFSSAFSTNRFMPTGGLIRPICTTSTISTPNQTGSKPRLTTIGKNTGTVSSTIDSSSMMVPSRT